MSSQFVPLDKSWVIRMGVLDLMWGQHAKMIDLLSAQRSLGDDLIALRRCLKAWDRKAPMYVGESGTLYRFLRFVCWRLNIEQQFVLDGTLKDRPICSDPNIIHWDQRKLLTLDDGTSQWASAAVLCGDPLRLKDAPYKLKLTYEAYDEWNRRRDDASPDWRLRPDQTILNQIYAFELAWMGCDPEFVPKQAEDFCFSYALGLMSAEEGERRWPQLRGHESNRLTEMPRATLQAQMGVPVESRDHRVVQAIALWGVANKKKVTFLHPQVASKSWPQFWEFIRVMQT